MTPDTAAERRWTELTDWPLMAIAMAFLAAYAVPIIQPAIPPTLNLACSVVAWSTWAVFVLDYAVRLALAPAKKRFVAMHLLDLLIIALPLLRPLRLLRVVTLLAVLNRRASSSLRGKIVVYVAGGSALLAFCGALAVLDAERSSPEANIVGFGDAIWWAFTTMTTVGYGDRYPVTGIGRTIAVALMIGGIAILGTLTATIASWLVELVSNTEEAATDELRSEIVGLRTQIQELSNRLSQDATASSKDGQSANNFT